MRLTTSTINRNPSRRRFSSRKSSFTITRLLQNPDQIAVRVTTTVEARIEVSLQHLQVFDTELCDGNLLQLGYVSHSVCDESVVNSQQRFKFLWHPKDVVALKVWVDVDVWKLFYGLLDKPCRALTSTATRMASMTAL
jgi:hypothetical protein